jgi:hypothetical protein
MTGPVDPDDYPEHTIRPLRPVAKVVAATVAGAVTVLLVWIAGLFRLDVPPEVAAAVTVVLSSAAGYLRPDPLS